MQYSRILIIRTDRIGDCILSIPAAGFLKKLFPDAEIDVLTTPYTSDIFSENPAIKDILIDDPAAFSVFSAKFRKLIKQVRDKKYDICFILHITPRAALIPFAAGVPVRVAPASKIYQFLATDRIAQKRSQCMMNESEYNVRLIKDFLNIDGDVPAPVLHFNEKADSFAENYLNCEFSRLHKMSYQDFKLRDKKLVMVHPGSGGSALNMSAVGYIGLIEGLQKAGHEVFLSTGPREEELKEQFLSRLGNPPLSNQSDFFKGGQVLKNTFALISKCDAVIAPSTGIMHAAVALEKPVAALFCPIFVCVPKRWGPDPFSKAKNIVLMPELKCDDPANITNEKYCTRCIGSKCRHYNCMDKISIESILRAVEGLLL